MHTIILSLHGRWWKKMLTGEKRLEIRKTRLVRKGPFRVLVYVTGTGEIQGEFICGDFLEIQTMRKEGCLTEKELKGYAGDRKKPLWGWLISDAKKYDIPRKIEFYGLKRPPQSWQYYEEERTC